MTGGGQELGEIGDGDASTSLVGERVEPEWASGRSQQLIVQAHVHTQGRISHEAQRGDMALYLKTHELRDG